MSHELPVWFYRVEKALPFVMAGIAAIFISLTLSGAIMPSFLMWAPALLSSFEGGMAAGMGGLLITSAACTAGVLTSILVKASLFDTLKKLVLKIEQENRELKQKKDEIERSYDIFRREIQTELETLSAEKDKILLWSQQSQLKPKPKEQSESDNANNVEKNADTRSVPKLRTN